MQPCAFDFPAFIALSFGGLLPRFQMWQLAWPRFSRYFWW
jgi:hypothetical protein